MEKLRFTNPDKHRSDLELLMDSQLAGANIEKWEIEFKFFKTRQWKFDFAWPHDFVALEVEGGTYSGGRHTRGKGFSEDCEKYNTAAIMGWTVIRATGEHVKKGMALAWIQEALK